MAPLIAVSNRKLIAAIGHKATRRQIGRMIDPAAAQSFKTQLEEKSLAIVVLYKSGRPNIVACSKNRIL